MTTPARFGRYEVRRVLGRGGMGLVYEGHDPQIDRAVAIKTIALDALDAREAAEFEGRFRAEMRSAGRLQHQNIVALYDTGRDDGTAYIVMELVRGQDLKQRLAGGWRPGAAEAAAIVLQLLAALEYAHAQRVVHRDVKPANLMLQDDGRLKLCDFGVARLADADATRTRGMVVGTARYASPEQLSGGEVDARTDLYAAGVVLYELLTGRPPFSGANELETIARIGQQQAPRPSAANAALPATLDAVVLRALEKDPARRFASAAEFTTALRAASAAAPVAAPGPPARRPWLALAALPLLLIAVAAWWLRPHAAPPAIVAAAPKPAQRPASAALRWAASWSGQYACGEVLNSTLEGTRAEPFSAPIALEIDGTRISWSRKGKTSSETVSGRIDASGRFSAEGEGADNAPGAASRWTVQASGSVNPKAQPLRLEGAVRLLRAKDGTLARECTMSAVPR